MDAANTGLRVNGTTLDALIYLPSDLGNKLPFKSFPVEVEVITATKNYTEQFMIELDTVTKYNPIRIPISFVAIDVNIPPRNILVRIGLFNIV